MQVIHAGMSLSQINAIMAARLATNEPKNEVVAAAPQKTDDRMDLSYGDEYLNRNVFDGLFATEEPVVISSVPAVAPVEIKGSARFDLKITEAEGVTRLLASADSATMPAETPAREQGKLSDLVKEEVSLEAKIIEAVSKAGVIVQESESAIVAALHSASKANVRRNNATRNK